MEFAPDKSELMYLTRSHDMPTKGLRLGSTLVYLTPEARFLGVWLDRKLKWKAHLKATKAKFLTQKYALTKLAASAWGCSLVRAREIYTKVIRSAIAYRAGVWHCPASQRAKGIGTKLSPLQSECLRIVSGAYRATPIRNLETETVVPPLDLYLTRRVAEFEQRLQHTKMDTLINGACVAVANRLRCRRRRARQRRPDSSTHLDQTSPGSVEAGQSRTQWVNSWVGQLTAREAMLENWKERWSKSYGESLMNHRRHAVPADNPEFSPKALRKHKDLLKHESSLLVQIRTGKVGLRAFLFERHVPEVVTPRCRCGNAAETPQHLVLDCSELAEARIQLQQKLHPRAIRSYYDYIDTTTNPKTALVLVQWLLATRRFPEYRLAIEISSLPDKGEDEEEG